jgi:hypothetical protein
MIKRTAGDFLPPSVYYYPPKAYSRLDETLLSNDPDYCIDSDERK